MWVATAPSSSSPAPHGTLGCCQGNVSLKTRQESPFPPSSKGQGRKSVQGFKRSWGSWLMVVAALTRPNPISQQESWALLLRGEQRGCQTNSGNSSHEKQGKAARRRLWHQTDVSISSPGSCHRNKTREPEMCRWDLSPAILLLFPADWDCKSPLPVTDSSMRRIGTWFWQLQAWQTAARAGPENTDGGEKTKRRRSSSAGALWFVSRAAPQQDGGSAAQGALPEVRRALHFPFPSSTFSCSSLRNTWNHLPPWVMLFKGYWKSTYLGQESSLSSMAVVVGGSEWESRDREYLRIWDTQTPVWSRRSLLGYLHILPKEGTGNHLRNWRSHLGYPTRSA